MISQSTIDEIKSRANILEIVSDFATVKRQGSGYVACCPFHNERSPSFHIKEHDQYFHCFGCGKSGNIFSFVMEIKGLSFPEAVEDLANRYGIEVKREGVVQNGAPKVKKDEIFAINKLALEFFYQTLNKRDPKVVEYVNKRSLKKKTVEKFGVGYAPLFGNELTKYLRTKKISDELLLLSGLSRRSQKGDLYDSLRGRLIFPILTDGSKIAGFGGRVIPTIVEDQNAPKYINSPETPVYNKSKILYGLPYALASMKEKGEVYVVEGYLDVIGLWQVGITNVVATCGTALTSDHVKRLSRLVNKISLLFDGDNAGRNAAAKSFPLFLNSEVDVYAVFLDEGEDPDSIALKYGSNAQSYLEGLDRVSLLDSYINHLLHSMNVQDINSIGAAILGQVCKELTTHLKTVKDPIVQDALVTRAALRLRVPKTKLFEVVQSGVLEVEKKEEQKASQASLTELPSLDQNVLLIVMAKKSEYIEKILKTSLWNEILAPSTMLFINGLDEALAGDDPAEQKETVKGLLTSLGAPWSNHWKKAHEMLNDKVDFNKMYLECLKDAQKRKILRDVQGLRQRALEAFNEDEKIKLHSRAIDLEKELRHL